MGMGTLTAAIREVAQGISAGQFQGEVEVSQGVVKRLLHELGWDIFDVAVVAPEFRIDKRKVDYALCDPPGKPSVLTEVKGLGKADSRGEKQLFEYCFHQGVPIALLTDGRVWSFFFPAGQGSYGDRRFKRVDLVDDDPAACSEVLDRYLRFDHVRSGAARKHAELDYEAARSEKEAAASYDEVWAGLLAGPDSRLLDLFREEVARETGLRPGRESAAGFLRGQGGHGGQQRPAAKPTVDSPSPSEERDGDRFWYQLDGTGESFRWGSDLLVAVFDRLADRDPTFLSRYSDAHRGRTRRYVASSREELYDNTELRKYGKPLRSGWWTDANCSNQQKLERIKWACQVAGITFGRDLVVGMGDG